MINLKDIFLTEGGTIGSFSGEFTVRIDIVKTSHGEERQYRHGARDIITDEKIIRIVQSAYKKILEEMVMDRLGIGDTLVIQERRSNTNVVCRIGRAGNKIEIVVITVMIKSGFTTRDFVIQV